VPLPVDCDHPNVAVKIHISMMEFKQNLRMALLVPFRNFNKVGT